MGATNLVHTKREWFEKAQCRQKKKKHQHELMMRIETGQYDKNTILYMREVKSTVTRILPDFAKPLFSDSAGFQQ